MNIVHLVPVQRATWDCTHLTLEDGTLLMRMWMSNAGFKVANAARHVLFSKDLQHQGSLETCDVDRGLSLLLQSCAPGRIATRCWHEQVFWITHAAWPSAIWSELGNFSNAYSQVWCQEHQSGRRFAKQWQGEAEAPECCTGRQGTGSRVDYCDCQHITAMTKVTWNTSERRQQAVIQRQRQLLHTQLQRHARIMKLSWPGCTAVCTQKSLWHRRCTPPVKAASVCLSWLWWPPQEDFQAHQAWSSHKSVNHRTLTRSWAQIR